MKVTTKTDIKEFPLLNRGKVRDIYDIDDSTLLIVTTDRMSAFDVIMNEPVPYKGVILNQITLFWMKKFAHLVKNHLIESDVDKFPAALAPYREELEGRSVLVKKAKPLPVECIVRGYITGSGWKDYKATGSVCGYKLPEGLLESARLEQPLFTPSTKAELGEHDENISTARAAEILGKDIADQIENIALALTIRRTAPQAIDPQVQAMANTLNIGDILDKYPYQVSGGQKQRCACARAIINHPKLVLADEPTGALDSHSAQMLLATLEDMHRQLGATILMVTHDAFSASYAQRILFLRDGAIFSELRRGTDSRKGFFDKILQVLTMMGGGTTDVR